MQNISCNIRHLLVAKVWQQNLDYAKVLQTNISPAKISQSTVMYESNKGHSNDAWLQDIIAIILGLQVGSSNQPNRVRDVLVHTDITMF